MKFHYRVFKSNQKNDTRYIASLIEFNIFISGDTLEEIDIEMKNAIDGYIQAFGMDELLIEHPDMEIRELEYDYKERMRQGNLEK